MEGSRKAKKRGVDNLISLNMDLSTYVKVPRLSTYIKTVKTLDKDKVL